MNVFRQRQNENINEMKTLQHTENIFHLYYISKAVASLSLLDGQNEHFLNLLSFYLLVSLIFPKIASFSSSLWFSGWVNHLREKALLHHC